MLRASIAFFVLALVAAFFGFTGIASGAAGIAKITIDRPARRNAFRPQTLFELQDAFNAAGLQIMSPHYMGDPHDAKVVKPDDWFPPPVKRDS